jgi:hypothetical protein
LTNGGPVTSTPNSQKSKSDGDGVEVREGGRVGGEVGNGESNAGVPADPIARQEEVALPKKPVPIATDSFGKLIFKIFPGKRSSKVPVPVPHPHLPLAPRPDISLASTSSPQRNRKWVLPADLPVGPGKVGP